jgi:hypothetical protein
MNPDLNLASLEVDGSPLSPSRLCGTEIAPLVSGLLETQARSRFGQTSEINLTRISRIELQLSQPRLVAATEAFLMKAINLSLKILFFMLLVSAGLTLFTGSVGAQDDVWLIVRADYGFQSVRTDVTDILRDLVARGGVNGRVAINNQTMGGDPAVGRDKTLRIFAKNRRNEERQFDVREGGSIETRFFAVPRDDWDDRGPGREDHARDDHPRGDNDRGDRDRGDHDRGEHDRGDLFILRGYYGAKGRTVNVTDRLRSMVRDGVLAVRVNNENFGGDPAIGADKVLIVIYRIRGEEQATAVREGERLFIP